MRIIFLHHAGGDRYAWRNYKGIFHHTVEQIYLELPGRGDRFGESLLTDIYNMVDDIYLQIQNYLDPPYIIVGNSMGALNAYLLSQKLQNSHQTLPAHLFLGSRPSPSAKLSIPKIADRETESFWEGIKSYGGVPTALLQHKEIMQLYEPILRADFRALENFELRKTNGLLDVPATIMIGKEDRFSMEEVKLWQNLFTQTPTFLEMEGGHFFMYDDAELIAQMIDEVIDNHDQKIVSSSIFGFN
ncbi:MAG: alpha/beta fold hydrolase [Chitinophagales bacterium]|nr:alpha/beta fold hydrolase [Chitinophagales bacterium]